MTSFRTRNQTPSSACGGGLGWGQPTRHCLPLAPTPAFPRKRGKEQTA